jgi:hypothetical protein
LFIGENKLCGDSPLDDGERGVVVVDGDSSGVVAGEP